MKSRSWQPEATCTVRAAGVCIKDDEVTHEGVGEPCSPVTPGTQPLRVRPLQTICTCSVCWVECVKPGPTGHKLLLQSGEGLSSEHWQWDIKVFSGSWVLTDAQSLTLLSIRNNKCLGPKSGAPAILGRPSHSPVGQGLFQEMHCLLGNGLFVHSLMQ